MMNETPAAAEPKPKRAPRGIQPKKQAAKNSVAVKVRRKILVKELLKGTPAKESGIIAGFSPATAASQVSHTIKDPKFQNSLLEAMDRAGINDDFLTERHRALLLAKKLIPARSCEGEPAGMIEHDDFQAQAKGLEMSYKLMGRFTDKHEIDTKQPVQIIIKKFCSRGTPPQEGAQE